MVSYCVIRSTMTKMLKSDLFIVNKNAYVNLPTIFALDDKISLRFSSKSEWFNPRSVNRYNSIGSIDFRLFDPWATTASLILSRILKETATETRILSCWNPLRKHSTQKYFNICARPYYFISTKMDLSIDRVGESPNTCCKKDHRTSCT